ncbi:hypothetical protein [Candidatus Uabimicrobium amorphum]|uniref:Uncharacterized protein n=1 Tax=Uabimicrobium amorphum TaxID=2596890 RepID=A0A5S9F4X0_UABAM|nr:hypothetical protein [Candidatus Uabimicrobium amorphum]BBM86225.1 hypothetical protein UABAM_04611 [Candidatus Uabimicrobium amorphum]
MKPYKFLTFFAILLSLHSQELSRDVIKKAMDQFASQRIFRIYTSRSQGSAVLLKTERQGDKVFGYFVTCYHVLRKSKWFSMKNQKKETILSRNVQVYNKPNADLTYIKAQLTKTPEGIKFSRNDDSKKNLHREALAIGYPVFKSLSLYPSKIRMWELETAFSLLNMPAKKAPYKFIVASGESTAKGMSGGAVVIPTSNGFFITGIVFGKLKNSVGLIIGAKQVEDLFPLESDLSNYKDASFEADGLSMKKVETHSFEIAEAQAIEQDKLSWNYFDVASALENPEMLQELRKDFQEIIIRKLPKDKKITLRTKQRDLNISLNGKKLQPKEIDITLKENGETQPKYEYEYTLSEILRGENLLIINKPAKRLKAYKFTDFITPCKLDVHLQADGKDFYHISRELPLQTGFTIYTTMEEEELEVEEISEANAALVVHKSFVEDLINKVPFRFPIAKKGSVEGLQVKSSFHGTLYFNPQCKINVIDHQSLEYEATGGLYLDDFNFNTFLLGAKVNRQTLPFRGTTRMQFLQNYIAIRATKALSSDTNFNVPIKIGSLEMNPNISNIAKELIINFINNVLVGSEIPFNNYPVEPVGLVPKSIILKKDWFIFPFQVGDVAKDKTFTVRIPDNPDVVEFEMHPPFAGEEFLTFLKNVIKSEKVSLLQSLPLKKISCKFTKNEIDLEPTWEKLHFHEDSFRSFPLFLKKLKSSHVVIKKINSLLEQHRPTQTLNELEELSAQVLAQRLDADELAKLLIALLKQTSQKNLSDAEKKSAQILAEKLDADALAKLLIPLLKGKIIPQDSKKKAEEAAQTFLLHSLNKILKDANLANVLNKINENLTEEMREHICASLRKKTKELMGKTTLSRSQRIWCNRLLLEDLFAHELKKYQEIELGERRLWIGKYRKAVFEQLNISATTTVEFSDKKIGVLKLFENGELLNSQLKGNAKIQSVIHSDQIQNSQITWPKVSLDQTSRFVYENHGHKMEIQSNNLQIDLQTLLSSSSPEVKISGNLTSILFTKGRNTLRCFGLNTTNMKLNLKSRTMTGDFSFTKIEYETTDGKITVAPEANTRLQITQNQGNTFLYLKGPLKQITVKSGREEIDFKQIKSHELSIQLAPIFSIRGSISFQVSSLAFPVKIGKILVRKMNIDVNTLGKIKLQIPHLQLRIAHNELESYIKKNIPDKTTLNIGISLKIENLKPKSLVFKDSFVHVKMEPKVTLFGSGSVKCKPQISFHLLKNENLSKQKVIAVMNKCKIEDITNFPNWIEETFPVHEELEKLIIKIFKIEKSLFPNFPDYIEDGKLTSFSWHREGDDIVFEMSCTP